MFLKGSPTDIGCRSNSQRKTIEEVWSISHTSDGSDGSDGNGGMIIETILECQIYWDFVMSFASRRSSFAIIEPCSAPLSRLKSLGLFDP